MTDILLISRDQCPYCENAKKLLAKKSLEYREQKIGVDIDRETVLESYPGHRMLPIIVVDGSVLGGYNELLDWLYPPMGNDDEQLS